MSDTISPSVTSGVPRRRDAVGRHGGPEGAITTISISRGAIVDAPLVAARRCDDPIHSTTQAVGFLRVSITLVFANKGAIGRALVG